MHEVVLPVPGLNEQTNSANQSIVMAKICRFRGTEGGLGGNGHTAANASLSASVVDAAVVAAVS